MSYHQMIPPAHPYPAFALGRGYAPVQAPSSSGLDEKLILAELATVQETLSSIKMLVHDLVYGAHASLSSEDIKTIFAELAAIREKQERQQLWGQLSQGGASASNLSDTDTLHEAMPMIVQAFRKELDEQFFAFREMVTCEMTNLKVLIKQEEVQIAREITAHDVFDEAGTGGHPATRKAPSVKARHTSHAQRDRMARHINKRHSLTEEGGHVFGFSWNHGMKILPSLVSKQRQSIEDVAEKCNTVKIPSQFEQFVKGPIFSGLSFSLIASNILWIGFVMNRSLENWRDGQSHIRETWQLPVDLVYAFAFLFEVLIRWAAFGRKFFMENDWKFNLFDILIVILSFLKLLLYNSFNLSVLRILRFLRIIRMLRVLRVLRFFSEFRAILVVVFSSASLLMWSGLLVFGWTFIMSLVALEFLVISADQNDASAQNLVNKYYSSVPATMNTFFLMTTGGIAWGDVAGQSADHVPVLRVVLVVYILPLLFNLIPIVFGCYTLKVFEMQKLDTFLAMHSREEEANKFMQDMADVLAVLKLSEEEELDKDRLEAVMSIPELEFFLETSGIKALPEEVYALFVKEGEALTMKQFMYGCQYLKLAGAHVDTIFLSDQVADLRSVTTDFRDDLKGSVAILPKIIPENTQHLMERQRKTSIGGSINM